MQTITTAPQTIIIRHRKENLHKCSLRGLEAREDLLFFRYPLKNLLPDLKDYILLTLNAPPLCGDDKDKGIVLLDGTWKYTEKMLKNIPSLFSLPKRSVPQGIRTAYPRRQPDCPIPDVGLASIEALFIAHSIMGKSTEGLLDAYFWKKAFLDRNPDFC